MSVSKKVKLLLEKYFQDTKKNPWGHLAFIAIIVYVTYQGIVSYIGPEQPGAFLERTSYERNIFVLVFPDKNSTKNYLLSGDVMRTDGKYTIDSVSWPSGGYSTFDSCEINLNAKSSCLITNSKKNEDFDRKMTKDSNYLLNNTQELINLPDYYVQLTNNPSNSER